MGKVIATEDGAKGQVQTAAVARDRAVVCLAGESKDRFKKRLVDCVGCIICTCTALVVVQFIASFER